MHTEPSGFEPSATVPHGPEGAWHRGTWHTRALPGPLAWVVVGLALVASTTGLLVPAVYRDNALVTAAFRGNDVVTLFVAVPVLVATLLEARRRPTLALLGRLGMLLYMFYNYVFYLYGAAFNVLFLVYVALVVLSGFGLASGLVAVDAEELTRRFRAGAPARSVGAYLVGFALLLGSLWTAISLSFVATGVVPLAITQTGHPTGVVFAADLTMLVPVLLGSGLLLYRRQPWGYVLAPIVLLKASTYGMAMIAMSALAGLGADPILPLWAGLTLGCVVSTGLLLGHLEK